MTAGALRLDQYSSSKPTTTPLTKQISSLRNLTIFSIISFVILLILLLQIQSFTTSTPFSFPTSASLQILNYKPLQSCNSSVELDDARQRLLDAVDFRTLKNAAYSTNPFFGNTWFMSYLDNTYKEEDMVYIYLPSAASKGRILCIGGSDSRDGTKNYYGLAWPDALPRNATFMKGLTFIADTYYDFENLWHGLTSMAPFAGWMAKNHCSDAPERWVLYHWGEVRGQLGRPWLKSLMEAATGRAPVVETFDGLSGQPACFEKALVFRANDGKMNGHRKREAFDLLRCKARAYCNISSAATDTGNSGGIGLTLLLRKGTRAFRDEVEVIRVFEGECKKVQGCKFSVAWGNNLTFCDQVRLMSKTDILASPHGAQMTNMFLMDKNSSVMEFFPKGWLELAGAGQFVFHWFADYVGLQHRGVWRDSKGPECPYKDNARCFTFYKDRELGHDAAYFANWTAKVLTEVKSYKLSIDAKAQSQLSSCPCS